MKKLFKEEGAGVRESEVVRKGGVVAVITKDGARRSGIVCVYIHSPTTVLRNKHIPGV